MGEPWDDTNGWPGNPWFVVLWEVELNKNTFRVSSSMKSCSLICCRSLLMSVVKWEMGSLLSGWYNYSGWSIVSVLQQQSHCSSRQQTGHGPLVCRLDDVLFSWGKIPLYSNFVKVTHVTCHTLSCCLFHHNTEDYWLTIVMIAVWTSDSGLVILEVVHHVWISKHKSIKYISEIIIVTPSPYTHHHYYLA